MADYKSTSPYFLTKNVNGTFLDIMNNRSIPKLADDQQFTITQTYNFRPDLLAFDLYGTPNLWWVFAQRNPNALVDPLLDFATGTTIFLPRKSVLQDVLGF